MRLCGPSRSGTSNVKGSAVDECHELRHQFGGPLILMLSGDINGLAVALLEKQTIDHLQQKVLLFRIMNVF